MQTTGGGRGHIAQHGHHQHATTTTAAATNQHYPARTAVGGMATAASMVNASLTGVPSNSTITTTTTTMTESLMRAAMPLPSDVFTFRPSQCVFYLDLGENPHAPKLVKYINSLGGLCATFLDKNVTHLITDKAKTIAENFPRVQKWSITVWSVEQFASMMLKYLEHRGKTAVSPTLQRVATKKRDLSQYLEEEKRFQRNTRAITPIYANATGTVAAAVTANPVNNNVPAAAGVSQATGTTAPAKETSFHEFTHAYIIIEDGDALMAPVYKEYIPASPAAATAASMALANNPAGNGRAKGNGSNGTPGAVLPPYPVLHFAHVQPTTQCPFVAPAPVTAPSHHHHQQQQQQMQASRRMATAAAFAQHADANLQNIGHGGIMTRSKAASVTTPILRASTITTNNPTAFAAATENGDGNAQAGPNNNNNNTQLETNRTLQQGAKCESSKRCGTVGGTAIIDIIAGAVVSPASCAAGNAAALVGTAALLQPSKAKAINGGTAPIAAAANVTANPLVVNNINTNNNHPVAAAAKAAPARPRPGYCECCFERYSDLEKHVRTIFHRQYALQEENYSAIDDVLFSLERPLRHFSAGSLLLTTHVSASSIHQKMVSSNSGKGSGVCHGTANIGSEDLPLPRQQQPHSPLSPSPSITSTQVARNYNSNKRLKQNMAIRQLNLDSTDESESPTLSSPSFKRRRSQRIVQRSAAAITVSTPFYCVSRPS